MESQIDMTYERETKGYWVYREVNGGINKLYLQKVVPNLAPAPKSITLIIQVNKE